MKRKRNSYTPWLESNEVCYEKQNVYLLQIQNTTSVWLTNLTAGYILKDYKIKGKREIYCSSCHYNYDIDIPSSEWLAEEKWYILYNRIIFIHKKNKIPLSWINIDEIGGHNNVKETASYVRATDYLNHLFRPLDFVI